MEINFNQELKKIDGDNLMEDKKTVTLSKICQNAILAPKEKQTGEDKVKCYKLAMKISDGGIIDLKSEEIALIKKEVGEIYPALIVGQVWEMLELKNLIKKRDEKIKKDNCEQPDKEQDQIPVVAG